MIANNNRPTKEEWQKTMAEIVGNGNMDVRGGGSCKSRTDCEIEACESLGITVKQAIKFDFIKKPKPKHNFLHFICNFILKFILNFIYFFRNWSSSMRQNNETAQLQKEIAQLQKENAHLRMQRDSSLMAQDVIKLRGSKRSGNQGDGDGPPRTTLRRR